MSHGTSSSDKPIEPNLVPLLDLVLQLVMFFMVCTNFIMEQLDASIKLPTAQTAKSLDRSQSNLLFINVSDRGHVMPMDGDRAALITPGQIEQYMKRKFKYRADTSNVAEAEKTIVIIRAHQNAKFEAVYRVLKSVKQAGFKKLQLRAMIPTA